MKTIKITIYELLGLIKDGKAPKKIKYQNEIWYLVLKPTIQGSYDYENENNEYLILEMLKIEYLTDVLKTEVEALEEVEEDEFEDIEEIKMIGCNVEMNILGEEIIFGTDTPIVTEHCISKINALIKNQKKIIERLNK